jgi:hypothetical protein
MGKYNASKRWLWRQIESAMDDLMDIRRGHRIIFDGTDVTEVRKSSLLLLIRRYVGLTGIHEFELFAFVERSASDLGEALLS